MSGRIDLLLVALLEPGPRDQAVADLVDEAIRQSPAPDVARLLGQRLIARAGLGTDQPASASPPAVSAPNHEETP